jgi:hypothetical protein
MAGAAGGPIQQTIGQVTSQIPKYMQPYMNNMIPQQPGLVQAGQGGFGQGTPSSLPPGFQSPYANYGFDSGFQNYLDQRYMMGQSAQDMGQYSYDPTNKMFTLNGAYLSPGTPTPTMSLADMMNRYQNPYQPPTMPLNKPGTFNPYNRPGQPPPFPRFGGETPRRPFDMPDGRGGMFDPRSGARTAGNPPNQRGPADRNLQPAVLTQGLAGLAGMLQGKQ